MKAKRETDDEKQARDLRQEMRDAIDDCLELVRQSEGKKSGTTTRVMNRVRSLMLRHWKADAEIREMGLNPDTSLQVPTSTLYTLLFRWLDAHRVE